MTCNVKELVTQFKISEENIPLSVMDFTIEEYDKSYFNKGVRNKNILYFTGEQKQSDTGKVDLELIIDLTDINVEVIDGFYQDKLKDGDGNEELILEELLLERIKFTYTMKDNFTGFESYNIWGGLIQQA